jgi:hypothetical protein
MGTTHHTKLTITDERISCSVFAGCFCDGECTAEDGKDNGLFEVWIPGLRCFPTGSSMPDYLLCLAVFGRNSRSTSLRCRGSV